MVGEEVRPVEEQVAQVQPLGEEGPQDLLLDASDPGPGEDHLPVLVLLVRTEEQTKSGKQGTVVGVRDRPVEWEAAAGVPGSPHVATALRALDPSEDLDEDEQGRQVGELSLRRQVLLESLQEAGLPRRVEVGRVLPERESPKGEGPGAGVQSLVELAGGADVDLANVPRALLRPRLLDDVEVAVSPAVAEFEGPLNFDAIHTGNASGYIAVAVGIASLQSASTEGKVALGYQEAHSDAMLFPIEEELPMVKSGLAAG